MALTTLPRFASVYSWPDRILVCSASRTTAGVRLVSPPLARLEAQTSPEALGAHIVAALAAFQPSVPHPTDWKGRKNPLLAAAGFRSNRLFHWHAVLCNVVQFPRHVLFEPTRNGGFTGEARGFREVTAPNSKLPWPSSDAALGKAAFATLKRCVPYPQPEEAT